MGLTVNLLAVLLQKMLSHTLLLSGPAYFLSFLVLVKGLQSEMIIVFYSTDAAGPPVFQFLFLFSVFAVHLDFHVAI